MLLRSPLRSSLRAPAYSPLVGKAGTAFVPSLAFPSNIATIDMDFVNNQFFGGVLPDAGSSDDGRLLRQGIITIVPNYVEQADGSLKTYNANSAVRRSNLHGLFVGSEFTNQDLQARTFSDASWTKVGCTVSKNAIGRTGASNSCCTITLTATTATITRSSASSDATARDRIATIEAKQTVGTGGALTLSVDNGATFPALTTKAIPGANARGFTKYRFTSVQNIASPQKQIKITGTVGDQWVLDFSETIDSGATYPGDITLEHPPIATTTGAVKIWGDRAFAGEAGYSGTVNSSPASTFLRAQATQAHYFEYWQRLEGGLIASAGGVQISSNLSVGGTGFGVTTATGGVGTLPNFTTDLYVPTKNKLMLGQSAGESFICLNNSGVITGSGGDASNISDHDDWGTNGSRALRNGGGIFRHVMSTDYASMKALALAGATL